MLRELNDPVEDTVEFTFDISPDIFQKINPITVEVRGEFEDWGFNWESGLPMEKVNGRWVSSIKILRKEARGKLIQFRYCAKDIHGNIEWSDEYQAQRVPNNYNSRNSVIDLRPQGVRPIAVVKVS